MAKPERVAWAKRKNNYMADIKVKLYDFQGKETGEEILDAKLFGVEADPEIIHSSQNQAPWLLLVGRPRTSLQ